MVQTDGAGMVVYAAVELMNPYPFPIRIENWQLAAVDRSAPTTTGPTLVTLVTFNTTDTTVGAYLEIPAADVATGTPGYLFVDTGTAGAAMGVVPPTSTAKDDSLVVGTTDFTVVPDFSASLVEGTTDLREIVLIRPPRNNVPLTTYTLDDYVPLDGVDLRGINPTNSAGPQRYRYTRPTGPSTATDLPLAIRDWDYVWGGQYAFAGGGNAASTDVELFNTPTAAGYNGQFFNPDDAANTNKTGTKPEAADAAAMPPAPASTVAGGTTIQVGPVLSGPWRGPGHAKPTYPYGGFARDGDALGVPFIGGYRLSIAPAGGGPERVADFVPVSLDAAFAHADAATMKSGGHFYEHVVAAALEDRWAADLLDYFAALNTPGQNRFPQADRRYENLNPTAAPAVYADTTLYARGDITAAATPLIWKDAVDGLSTFSGASFDGTRRLFDTLTTGLPAPLNGFNAGDNTYAGAFTPEEGRINVNTASVGILKTLPLEVNGTGNVSTVPTATAATIFTGRLADGPVASPLGFLNKTANRDLEETATSAGSPGLPALGDISGRIQVDTPIASLMTDEAKTFYDPLQTNTTGDYEKKIQRVVRLSNLTTARSDSFTVYVVVQAWRLPETGVPARLMRQERTAFVVDRSAVPPFNPATGAAWTAGDVNGQGFESALRVTPIPTK